MPAILLNSMQVMLGASIGALLRYWATLFLPLPILLVNVIGSLIIGYTYNKLAIHNPQLIPFINIGLLGGLTSFSSFSLDVFNYIQEGAIIKASLYIVASVLICIFCCFLGYKLASI
ncbi:MAG: CrcB family protein [Candidatus Melainabacteria bacterium]|jgi:fluoride exporter|nr:CrcB family protein [Candidatus Melainabacteria bacterium]